MKRFKKFSLFFVLICFIFILAINIFIIFSNKSLSSQISDLSTLKTKVTVLDDFKTIIVNLGHSQKFYLLSEDENYKVKYNNYLSDAFNSIDELAENKYIDEAYKEELITLLNNYNNINLKLMNDQIQLPLNAEMQTYLTQSNEIQINIMHKISTAIAANRDTTTQNQTNLAKSINTEKNIIQILSSAITLIIGGPAYGLYTKYKNGELHLSEIINVLDKEQIKVDNYSNIITYTSILNNHNKEMKKHWIEVQEKVENLQNTIDTLKNEALNCKISFPNDFSREIQLMEIKLLEIKLLIQQLPNYHEFVISLTDSMLSSEKEKQPTNK